MPYSLSPTPQGGSGPFGSVPGQIKAPSSIYDQLKENVPNYSALTNSAAGDIGNELAGRISPETINLLQNKAASLGASSGVPGSGFSNNAFLESLGLTSEGQIDKGLTEYNRLSQTAGGQQLSPELQTEIATQNAVDGAAPNPAAAQSYAQQLFDKYMKQQNPTSKLPNGGNYFTPAGSSTPMPYANAYA